MFDSSFIYEMNQIDFLHSPISNRKIFHSALPAQKREGNQNTFYNFILSPATPLKYSELLKKNTGLFKEQNVNSQRDSDKNLVKKKAIRMIP